MKTINLLALPMLVCSTYVYAYPINLDFYLKNNSEYDISIHSTPGHPGMSSDPSRSHSPYWHPAEEGEYLKNLAEDKYYEFKVGPQKEIKLGNIVYSWNFYDSYYTFFDLNIVSTSANHSLTRKGKCEFYMKLHPKGMIHNRHMEIEELHKQNVSGCEVNIDKASDGKVYLSIIPVFKPFKDIDKLPECVHEQRLDYQFDDYLKPKPICEGGKLTINLPAHKPLSYMNFSFEKPKYRTSEQALFNISGANGLSGFPNGRIQNACEYGKNNCSITINPYPDTKEAINTGSNSTVTLQNNSKGDLVTTFYTTEY